MQIDRRIEVIREGGINERATKTERVGERQR